MAQLLQYKISEEQQAAGTTSGELAPGDLSDKTKELIH